MRIATGQIWQSRDGHNIHELVIVHDIDDDDRVHIRGKRLTRVQLHRFIRKYHLVADVEPIR